MNIILIIVAFVFFAIAVICLVVFIINATQRHTNKTIHKDSKLLVSLPLIFFMVFAFLGWTTWPTGGKPEKEINASNIAFNVSDSSGTPDLSGLQLNISIPSRYNKEQIDTICSIIKERNYLYKSVKLFFLLPGQVVGDGFVYGFAFYPDMHWVTKDTYDHDLNKIPYEQEIDGLSAAKANELLKINPPNMQYKHIYGKFIEDTQKSVTIIYSDTRDEKNRVQIMDYYVNGVNRTENNISTPIKKVDDYYKFIINKEGDYYTLKDSVLQRYDLESSKDVPYHSIKSGI